MTLLGKKILTTWTHNGGFVERWLRTLNRETKRYYMSDVAYTLVWGSSQNETKYKLHKPWAKKFLKTPDGIVRSNSRLNNTDGEFSIKVVENVTDLLCPFTFAELFETNVSELYSPDSDMVEQFNFLNDLMEIKKDRFNLINYSTKDDPVVGYLRDFFQCNEIYKLSDMYWTEERASRTIVEQSQTYWHINHFCGYKPLVTAEEAYKNTSIAFWYFGDKVVYRRIAGRDTW